MFKCFWNNDYIDPEERTGLELLNVKHKILAIEKLKKRRLRCRFNICCVIVFFNGGKYHENTRPISENEMWNSYKFSRIQRMSIL